jgi:hypothetical protein
MLLPGAGAMRQSWHLRLIDDAHGLRGPAAALALAVIVLLTGCAAGTLPPSQTQPATALGWQERARAQPVTKDGVTVTVAALRPQESEAEFGLPLAAHGVQPVWVRIENRSATSYRLIRALLDRDYFSPREVAYRFNSFDTNRNNRTADMLTERQTAVEIPAGATVSGFVYTNVTRGIKLINIELAGARRPLRFAFAREQPGGNFDFNSVDVGRLYPPARLKPVDLTGLRAALTGMDCCTTDARATRQGDPLKLVMVGDQHDVLVALVRAGWDFTEITSGESVARLVGAFLFGTRYRTSPVSPLHHDGRPQDFSMQRARSTISQRNHLRLWMTPLRVDDKPVWIGQVSRDIGVRFTLSATFFTTHAIDPDVDEARAHLLQELLIGGSIERLAFARGVGEVTREAPRQNLTGDPWFSDGLRLVVFVAAEPRGAADFETLEWDAVPAR